MEDGLQCVWRAGQGKEGSPTRKAEKMYIGIGTLIVIIILLIIIF